jgi:hypothetical protein
MGGERNAVGDLVVVTQIGEALEVGMERGQELRVPEPTEIPLPQPRRLCRHRRL